MLIYIFNASNPWFLHIRIKPGWNIWHLTHGTTLGSAEARTSACFGTHYIVPPQLWMGIPYIWTGPLALRWWHPLNLCDMAIYNPYHPLPPSDTVNFCPFFFHPSWPTCGPHHLLISTSSAVIHPSHNPGLIHGPYHCREKRWNEVERETMEAKRRKGATQRQ